MSLIQYFRSVFGGASVSVFDTLGKIESLLTSIFENLPNTILIRKKSEKSGFKIDLTRDKVISHEEYTLLHSVFSQFSPIADPEVIVTCTYGPMNQEIEFTELLKKYPGIYKIIRSVLFLDFHNSAEFINSAISLYELMTAPKFVLLPSSDKRDSYLHQLKELNAAINKYTGEYDVLSADYAQFSKEVDHFGQVVKSLETDRIISEMDETPADQLSDTDVSIPLLQLESRKVTGLIEKLKKTVSTNEGAILEISKKNRITVTDSSRQKELSRINKRRNKLIETLSGRQLAIVQEVEQLTRQQYSKKSAQSAVDAVGTRTAEVKENLRVAEARRKQVHGTMTDLKTRINALKIEALGVEEKIKSEGIPVDMNRLSSENLLLLDADASLHEKTSRFLLSYFNHLEPRAFLTLKQRRDLLKTVYPNLQLKSVSLISNVRDSENFIEVSE